MFSLREKISSQVLIHPTNKMYYQPIVIYREVGQERKNSILRYIGNRVLTSNKNFICGVTGKTGDGKSWSSLAMCEDYCEMFNIPFDPKIHVIRSLKQLLELIINKELHKNIQVGSALLFDEPQVETSADEWQSMLSKALTTLLSTFRNQRLVMFFCMPYMNMIPKKSRTLFHGEFRVLGFDKTTKMATLKPRFLEYNENYDMFYKKRLLIMYKVDNKRHLIKTKLNKWQVEKASDHIIEVYEAFKKDMTDKINLELYQKILENESKERGDAKSKDFLKVAELYNKYGEDYVRILNEIPTLTPYTLENYLRFIKRAAKTEKIADPST